MAPETARFESAADDTNVEETLAANERTDVKPRKVADHRPPVTFADNSGTPTTATGDQDRLVRIERKLDHLLRSDRRSVGEGRFSEGGSGLVDRLRGADVPEDFIVELVSSLDEQPPSPETYQEAAYQGLVTELSKLMESSFSLGTGDRAVIFGHCGAGKSSVMGKMATQLVAQQGRKVKLAGLGFHKVGAHEELAAYADLLDVDIGDNADDETSSRRKADSITLIDSPAMPLPSDDLEAFAKAVDGTRPTHRLAVVSALLRSDDISELAQQYRQLSPTHIIVTMLDVTTRHGAVVAMARLLGVPIVYINESPGGTGTLRIPDPARLARNLLRCEVCHAEA